jgi:uncharacterized Zn-finger protein
MATKRSLPWYVIALGVLILALFGFAPFVLGSNPTAQVFFNLSIAIITTLVSIYATRHYAKNQERDELLRYGLQAWRNLDSLQVKVSQHLGSENIPGPTLHAWIMDIDGAKWAWQDLLRELFQLQDRLQGETDEVVEKYKRAIAGSASVEERASLEKKQATELAQLAARAPLPIKLPEEVACPKCDTRMTARVGSAPGDSGWPICPNCNTRLAVFRQSDGSVKLSDRAVAAKVTNPCPHCGAEITIDLYGNREVSCLISCSKCHAHIQFTGSPESQNLVDLGVENAEFTCPHCGSQSQCWISPSRRVSFAKECKTCRKFVRVTGTLDEFKAVAG